MQLSVNIISTNCRFVKNLKINASHLGSSACVDREALSVNFNNSVTSLQTCHVQVCLQRSCHSISFHKVSYDQNGWPLCAAGCGCTELHRSVGLIMRHTSRLAALCVQKVS